MPSQPKGKISPKRFQNLLIEYGFVQFIVNALSYPFGIFYTCEHKQVGKDFYAFSQKSVSKIIFTNSGLQNAEIWSASYTFQKGMEF